MRARSARLAVDQRVDGAMQVLVARLVATEAEVVVADEDYATGA